MDAVQTDHLKAYGIVQMIIKKGITVENLQNFDKQKIHFGYFIGLNQYNFKIDYKQNPNYTTQVEEELGLNIGLIGDLKINKHDFSISLSFNDIKTNLKINYNSIISFADPSANFGLILQ